MNDRQLSSTIWTVIFGVALGFGGSVLETIQIPGINITVATFWVVILVTLNKLVLATRWSVTKMYVVASIIGIFTPYLGPPSPLAPILILAGASFDLSTRLKTTDIKWWDLLVGHLFITVTGFTLVWVIFWVHTPDLAPTLVYVFLVGAAWQYGISILVTFALYRLIPPDNPPQNIESIRDQIHG